MTSGLQLPLFVFGTLRQGERNHYLLEGAFERMLTAKLYHYVRKHPLMIAPREGAEVLGELYFLLEASYDQTLRRCDQLEGIPVGQRTGTEYRRERVRVITPEGHYAAWAYVDAGSSPRAAG